MTGLPRYEDKGFSSTAISPQQPPYPGVFQGELLDPGSLLGGKNLSNSPIPVTALLESRSPLQLYLPKA